MIGEIVFQDCWQSENYWLWYELDNDLLHAGEMEYGGRVTMTAMRGDGGLVTMPSMFLPTVRFFQGHFEDSHCHKLNGYIYRYHYRPLHPYTELCTEYPTEGCSAGGGEIGDSLVYGMSDDVIGQLPQDYVYQWKGKRHFELLWEIYNRRISFWDERLMECDCQLSAWCHRHWMGWNGNRWNDPHEWRCQRRFGLDVWCRDCWQWWDKKWQQLIKALDTVDLWNDVSKHMPDGINVPPCGGSTAMDGILEVQAGIEEIVNWLNQNQKCCSNRCQWLIFQRLIFPKKARFRQISSGICTNVSL